MIAEDSGCAGDVVEISTVRVVQVRGRVTSPAHAIAWSAVVAILLLGDLGILILAREMGLIW